MAGLLTYPGFMKPSHPDESGQWQVFHKTIIVRTIGLHSSGYCCGFKPHSLFITMILFHCNTKTKINFLFILPQIDFGQISTGVNKNKTSLEYSGWTFMDM
jgi:hypothetical protein